MPHALVIRVHLHDGRYHGAGDWPPSPARLFQAMVAAAGLNGQLAAVRDSLKWFEELSAEELAASGARDLLESGLLRPASGQKIAGAARRLRDAARDEDHPRVLAYQLQAILAADLAPLSAAQHRLTRQYLVEALTSTAERAAAAATVEEADRFYQSAYGVLTMSELDEQREFGRRLGPCLHEFLTVPTAWWSEAQQGEDCRDAFERNISVCETTLRRIDRIVRSGEGTPDTRLNDAWDDDDPDAYNTDMGLWQDVVSRGPYGQ